MQGHRRAVAVDKAKAYFKRARVTVVGHRVDEAEEAMANIIETRLTNSSSTSVHNQYIPENMIWTS